MTNSQNDSSRNRLEKVLEYIFSKVLFPYQREWVLDRSRFKIGKKARQIGLSLMLGLEGVLDVLRREPVYYVSRTERQSVYLLDKFYKWADFLSSSGVPISFDLRNRTEARVNGVDIKSLTSHAVGDEGFTGNVYLDEFGLHDNDEQIYRSLFPTITWGYKIRIISRPSGQSNKFFQIFTDETRYPDYSRHIFDIYRAVKDGLPISIEEIRRNFDEEGFRENYLCEFLDEAVAYLPYELLRSCIGESIQEIGTTYLGVDIGRTRDLTVLYVLNKLGDKLYTRSIQVLKGKKFEIQRMAIEATIRREKIHRTCIDSTGIGMQLAEELKRDFPSVEPVSFTNEVKEGLVVSAKRVFEGKQIQIPDDYELISDCHSIKRIVTPSGNIRFDAEHTKTGHADRFWALALANEAASLLKPQKKLVIA